MNPTSPVAQAHRDAAPTETEEWRPVPGFPGYEVSNLGRVLSRKYKRPRVMASAPNSSGYRHVTLFREGRGKTFKVHGLVAAVFIGPRPDGHEVRHLDGDRLNNRLENLAYGTHSENMFDRVAHGRHPFVGRTHCSRGHEFEPETTRLRGPGQGRCCVLCRREIQKAFKARRRAGRLATAAGTESAGAA